MTKVIYGRKHTCRSMIKRPEAKSELVPSSYIEKMKVKEALSCQSTIRRPEVISKLSISSYTEKIEVKDTILKEGELRSQTQILFRSLS